MEPLRPETPEAVAEILASAARQGQPVRAGGGFGKDAIGGPVEEAGVCLSVSALNRVVQYDPRDLTVSVGAGARYSEISRVLAEHRQMIPLDPPLSSSATIGGIIAANSSGPRRRLYGTARDMVIGMKFATMEGKLVETGGMVVKNVAGLDVGKLLIGSFGTLAVLTSVNFRVHSMPPATRTFVMSFDSAAETVERRDAILAGVLQPAALDVVTPPAAQRLGRSGFLLALQAGGSPAVLERYARELSGAAALALEEEAAFWRAIRDFAPDHLSVAPEGAVARVSTTLSELKDLLESVDRPMVARAASGVAYVCFDGAGDSSAWARQASDRGWRAVVEWARPEAKAGLDMWPAPGGDFELMKAVKQMFDPQNLLNRGRLYGRI